MNINYSDLGTVTDIFDFIPDFDSFNVELIPQGIFVAFNYSAEIGYQFKSIRQYKLSGNFTLISRSEYKKFLDFWKDKKGAFKRFWIPTWVNKFKVVEPIGASDIVIKIENVEFNKIYNGHNRIFIFVSKGDLSESDLYIRKVTNVEVDENNMNVEKLYIDQYIGTDLLSEQITLCGEFILARFTQEGVSFQYYFTKEKDFYAVAQCSFIELPYEYSEIDT